MTLCDILQLLCGRPSLVLGIGPVSEQTAPVVRTPYYLSMTLWRGPKREYLGMITLTDSQQVVLTVKATDKKGNPTSVTPGSVAWFVDNTDLLTITDNGDGTATLKAVGPLGTGVVSVKATVNGTDVAGQEDVTVTSGAPTQLTIDAGTPSEQ